MAIWLVHLIIFILDVMNKIGQINFLTSSLVGGSFRQT